MAVNWVTKWWRAESEIDRLRAENDELRAQVESQSRLIGDCVEFQRRMKDEAARIANITTRIRTVEGEMNDIELRLCDISTVVDGRKVRP